MRWKGIRVVVLVAAVAASAFAASLARAELTASGDLFVKFSGGIEPKQLPRDARAPVAVRIAGVVRTLSGDRPPALRQLRIAINNGGRIDFHGLPVCHKAQIEPSSSNEALAACGAALVGSGSYAADIAYPEQAPFLSRGRILAFNSVVGGRHAILAHVYASEPAPITMVIVLYVDRRGGTFGTVLSGSVPQATIRWGYLKRITLSLHRDYVYRGRLRSYLSASCDAPPGFPGAVFPFARASMTFEDGRSLGSTISRTCRVLGG